MVHGDVREERQVLETRGGNLGPTSSASTWPTDAIDHDELTWLHDRRLRDIELADPDPRAIRAHRPGAGEARNPPRADLVIPYAADTRRFRPDPAKHHGASCTFLFAGGITQRKGIKYLLEAWRRVRRPGWRLQLLGPLPAERGPLLPYLDEVECLGRIAHAEVPARMAAADVFVFPSLFEGSAVVTYEALACGLPSIVTAEAGSVVRDGREGVIVPIRDVDALAVAMERLGKDPGLRECLAASARAAPRHSTGPAITPMCSTRSSGRLRHDRHHPGLSTEIRIARYLPNPRNLEDSSRWA